MEDKGCSPRRARQGYPCDHGVRGNRSMPNAHGTGIDRNRSYRLKRWLFANAIVSGLCALAWLILRSGPKPSRFAYPCQQAALSAATLALGAPLVSAIFGARRRLVTALSSRTGFAMVALGLVGAVAMWMYSGRTNAYNGPVLSAGADYRAQVFHVSDCPQAPDGDRFVGLDNLLTLMGREGTKFYRSWTESVVSGPEGIIAADDVVVVKFNYQWEQRGGTNMDLLRGLVLRLLDHPDAFTGEIVLCENAQGMGPHLFDRFENNAEDHTLSPRDVVNGFKQAGHPVSLYDWAYHRYRSVGEYSDGGPEAMDDGYVVYDYDARFDGRISYPKFQTDAGTYVSLRDGIWDVDTETYDRRRLKFINVPVLKAHLIFGATACVKNNMGVVTTELSTNSHWATSHGLMGALLGEIRPADLNILDCIWVSRGPNSGPMVSYDYATRRDMLVAGVDPVAVDIWSVTNILIPTFLGNDYVPPWRADPSDPGSSFRHYLDNSMSYLLEAGYTVTNNLAQVDVHTWNGAGDFDGDSDVDLVDYKSLAVCLDGPDVPLDPGCEGFFDHDGDADLRDFRSLQNYFSGPLP